MKVIAIFESVRSPLATTITDYIKEGEIYTVKGEQRGYSLFGKRMVDAYSFYEIDGLYEKGIFIPLSSIDEKEFMNKNKLLNKE